MKKSPCRLRIVISLASLFFIGQSYADVSIAWSGLSGQITDSDSNPVPVGSLAQLIWLGAGSDINSSPSALDLNTPLVPTGPDEVMASYIFPSIPPALIAGFLEPPVFNDATTKFDDSAVYVRIFNSSTPSLGSEWGDSSVFEIKAKPTAGYIDLIDITAATGGFQLTNVIIPEPSAFALFLFAAALFVNPWRFRRNG